jgi:hypothetical protein
MRDQTFYFLADVHCHLSDGSVQILNRYPIAFQASSVEQARSHLKPMYFEKITDLGSDVTNLPVDEIDLHNVVRR